MPFTANYKVYRVKFRPLGRCIVVVMCHAVWTIRLGLSLKIHDKVRPSFCITDFDMDWVYLSIITFAAATIQSATGFGFGLIAVPVFLLLLGSAEAIQMVMIIILCLSLLDWIKLRGQASRALLLRLCTGMLVGFPFGIIIYHLVDLPGLKAIIALVILIFSVQNLARLLNNRRLCVPHADKPNAGMTLFTGYISGLMSTSLAMPGPVVMLYLVHQGLEKTLIRATILTYFVFAYSGSILLQSVLVGISRPTWMNSLSLVPVGLAGVMCGHYLAHKINQKLFKLLVLSILILTALLMLYQL